jgi:hypothetical protein
MFEVTPRLKAPGLDLRSLALARVGRGMMRRMHPDVQVREGVGRRLVALRAQRANARRIIDERPDPRPVVGYFGRHFLPMLHLARMHARRVLVVRQPWFDADPTPEQLAMMWNYAHGRLRTEPVDTYYTHRVAGQLLRVIDSEAARLAREAGVEQLDILADLDKDFTTFYDYNHFTPHGANRVAELIARHVLGGAQRSKKGAAGAAPPAALQLRGSARTPPDPLSPSARA